MFTLDTHTSPVVMEHLPLSPTWRRTLELRSIRSLVDLPTPVFPVPPLATHRTLESVVRCTTPYNHLLGLLPPLLLPPRPHTHPQHPPSRSPAHPLRPFKSLPPPILMFSIVPSPFHLATCVVLLLCCVICVFVHFCFLSTLRVCCAPVCAS